MNDENQSKPIVDKATELAQQRTDLAIERTRIAAERTLMAWIRTAISMIGFGFTLYKFFQYLRESQESAIRLHGPRNLGLTLIGIGTASLIVALIEHRQFIKSIGIDQPKYLWSLAVIVGIMLSLVGVLAFANILLRVGPY